MQSSTFHISLDTKQQACTGFAFSKFGGSQICKWKSGQSQICNFVIHKERTVKH